MSIGGIRIKENIGPAAPAAHGVIVFRGLALCLSQPSPPPSFRACKGVGRRMQTRRAHSTLSAGEVSRAAIYHRQCWLQTCGLVFCFFSPPPQKSSAQQQIGRTAGLEPVRLDAYTGEMIRFSPMRNIGTSNIKTHLFLSTENLL